MKPRGRWARFNERTPAIRDGVLMDRTVSRGAIEGPRDVFRLLRSRFRRMRWREEFYGIFLNHSARVAARLLLAAGCLDEVSIAPREVFRAAIACGAYRVVLVHNHPGGLPAPSEADIRLTRRFARAGALLGIRVLDHLVVGYRGRQPRWVSLKQLRCF